MHAVTFDRARLGIIFSICNTTKQISKRKQPTGYSQSVADTGVWGGDVQGKVREATQQRAVGGQGWTYSNQCIPFIRASKLSCFQHLPNICLSNVIWLKLVLLQKRGTNPHSLSHGEGGERRGASCLGMAVLWQNYSHAQWKPVTEKELKGIKTTFF